MEEQSIIEKYLYQSKELWDFPSVESFQLYKNSIQVSEEEHQWIRIAQRDWILREISTDESLSSVSKLAEIRGLLLDWEDHGEEEEGSNE